MVHSNINETSNNNNSNSNNVITTIIIIIIILQVRPFKDSGGIPVNLRSK